MANKTHTLKKAKVKVRKIITKRVKAMGKVLFVTLSGKDVEHEKQVSGEGVRIKSINDSPQISQNTQRLLKLEDVPNAQAIHGDIFELIRFCDDGTAFVWFDFCDLAKSWGKFFGCIKEANFCDDSQIAVTFCAAPRAYTRGKFWNEHFPFLLDELKDCKDRPKVIADRIFSDCSRKMRLLGWRCNEALSYTVNGGKMVTLIFDRKKGAGSRSLRDLSPPKKAKKQKKQVDKTKIIKVWKYAQELGLSATELSQSFRNKQSIAHLTMAAKK
tara:strand:+ start:35 stop:847 length:813 start_codon:yes stop_codon:yes gene_type:complete